METPFALRFQGLRPKLDRASERSGVPKAALIRIAVAQFLESHSTPEALIAAQIRFRVGVSKRRTA